MSDMSVVVQLQISSLYNYYIRWFALMEMHLFLVMVLRMFDLELLDPLPPPVSQVILPKYTCTD